MESFTAAECDAITTALTELFLSVDPDDLDDLGCKRFDAARSALAKLPPVTDA